MKETVLYRMMVRTGMIREIETEGEIRVEIIQNAGASGGVLKSAIPQDEVIPRQTVADALQAEITDLEVEIAKNHWQSIETAPKDGRTLLLGYYNPCGKWRTVCGQWYSREQINEEWEEPEGGHAGWYETSQNADDAPTCWAITPTHWTLLPPEPSERTDCPDKTFRAAVADALQIESSNGNEMLSAIRLLRIGAAKKYEDQLNHNAKQAWKERERIAEALEVMQAYNTCPVVTIDQANEAFRTVGAMLQNIALGFIGNGASK